jgi:DNA polymerase-3 subunit alpha
VQDFVNWAKERDIVVGPGRGSAAGSLVSYLLNITNIDPIEYELLFERFLNPDRIAMPDIDLDFADTRRDEVIAYVREKYGADRVAQIITFGTMAARAAVRDTGRALGLPYTFCDMIAKLIPFHMSLEKSLANVQELKELYRTNTDAKRLLDEARRLEGVARHASTHACGVVITKEPITALVPLQHGTRGDNTVITQYEMHSIEALGLLKMDFLGLRNLTIIEETLKYIERDTGEKIDIDAISLNDATTFELLQRGETTGVFQLESGGMTRYLKDLKPTEFEDIIAMVALYRPGPMELLPHFISRKHGEESITYIHPNLEPILKNTYGVGVYQEQMMQIARDLAGFTLAEADTLRKAIGKKIKKLLDEQREKIIEGMEKNGIDTATAHKIWDLFPPFARYGFNRSHAACYALIAYQTAYLKAHWPEKFMAALLNAESNDVERVSHLTEEAKTMGIEVLAPDVNESGVAFAPRDKTTIRFGLGAIKNVGVALAHAIVDEREENGPFSSIEDFIIRLEAKDFNRKSLESLVKAGVFDTLEERSLLYGNLDNLIAFSREAHKIKHSQQSSLFDLVDTEAPPLSLRPTNEEIPKKTRLTWEKELLGLYVSSHPLAEVEQILKAHAEPIGELTSAPRQVRVGGIISKLKKIVTKTGQPMVFAELEDLSGKIEVVVFPTIFEKYSKLWQEEGVVLLNGKVQERDNALKFICEEARPLLSS